MLIALTLYNHSTAQEAFVAAWVVLIWECHLHRSNLKELTTCSSPCTRAIKCLPCITTCASRAELGLLADSPIARMTFHGDDIRLLVSKGYSSMHGLDAQRRLVVRYPLNSIAEGSNLFWLVSGNITTLGQPCLIHFSTNDWLNVVCLFVQDMVTSMNVCFLRVFFSVFLCGL